MELPRKGRDSASLWAHDNKSLETLICQFTFCLTHILIPAIFIALVHIFDDILWSETNVNLNVFVLGNIFISRKTVSSCDDCDDEEGMTSVVYKIGKMLPLMCDFKVQLEDI